MFLIVLAYYYFSHKLILFAVTVLIVLSCLCYLHNCYIMLNDGFMIINYPYFQKKKIVKCIDVVSISKEEFTNEYSIKTTNKEEIHFFVKNTGQLAMIRKHINTWNSTIIDKSD